VTRILLLGPARDAAGTRADDIDGATVQEVLDLAVARYGADFAAVLKVSQVWLNGVAAEAHASVGPSDEVAVLPPVSGG
jgi:molybdopterin converting factor small subunit